MILAQTRDAEFFNRICNLPEVRPGLGWGTHQIDMTAWVNSPNNVALRTEHGGFILVGCGAGFYSVHTQFAAEGRGQHAIEAMIAGLDFMFTRTDCMRITSHCPDNNPAALRLAEAGGAHPWFRAEVNPMYGPGLAVQWDIFDWLVNNEALQPEGEAFHALLDKAMEASPREWPDHPADPIHDRVAGGCALMCKRGQLKKGVLCYNLWATAAGYQPITIAPQPIDGKPAVDVGEGIIMTVREGELEVVECP